MTVDGEGPERPAWLDRLLRDPALAICAALPASMAAASAVLLIYGSGQDSKHTMSNGGIWLFFAFFIATPMKVGWWLRGRQRKITVEQKLDTVQDGLNRIEDVLTGARIPQRDVVRPLHRRLYPVPR